MRPTRRGPVRHTAASNAAGVRDQVAGEAGEDGLALGWRFGVLQILDDYTSCLRRGGTGFASQVRAQEPPSTGVVEVDVAFAALADFLAGRDGWQAPAWVEDPGRVCPRWWYPQVMDVFRSEADWVNDAAKGLLPGDDPEAWTVLEAGHLLVQVASPAYLLAAVSCRRSAPGGVGGTWTTRSGWRC